jgi:cytochrome c oxidase subunit 4
VSTAAGPEHGATTEVVEHPEHLYQDVPVPDEELPSQYQHHTDRIYIVVFVVLVALTAMEVSTYYISFGPIFLPLLFTLMSIKFFLVVWFFMHLRNDAKIFGRLFWMGLILAVAVYTIALSAFQFFSR